MNTHLQKALNLELRRPSFSILFRCSTTCLPEAMMAARSTPTWEGHRKLLCLVCCGRCWAWAPGLALGIRPVHGQVLWGWEPKRQAGAGWPTGIRVDGRA